MDNFKKSPLKKVGIILLIIGVKIVLVMALLFYVLPRWIYKQKGCDAFNIDNIELHTHIDIPENKVFSCDYNSKTQLKRVYFLIDKSKVTMERYISFSGFAELNAGHIFKKDDFLQMNVTTTPLFYKEQHKENGNYYKAILDTNTGTVWINLKYAD